MPPAYKDPCNGMFPHEQKPGCCPLSIVSQNRQITDGKRSATAKDVLPQALQGVVGASDMTYLNAVDHDTDHSFDFNGATVAELGLVTRRIISRSSSAFG